MALWAFGMGGRRLPFTSIVVIGVASAAVAALMFPYDLAMTGQISLAPHRLWADTLFGPGVDVLGFGKNVGIPLWLNIDPLPGHGLPDVILNANKNFSLLAFELFGWAAGSLVLAAVGLVLGPRKSGDILMIALCASVVLGHSFYWAPGGPDFGARYWYVIIVPLVVLTVRGAQAIGARLSGSAAGLRLSAAILIATASAFLFVLPWRCVTKYYRYRGIGGEVRSLESNNKFDGALVFVRAPER